MIYRQQSIEANNTVGSACMAAKPRGRRALYSSWPSHVNPTCSLLPDVTYEYLIQQFWNQHQNRTKYLYPKKIVLYDRVLRFGSDEDILTWNGETCIMEYTPIFKIIINKFLILWRLAHQYIKYFHIPVSILMHNIHQLTEKTIFILIHSLLWRYFGFFSLKFIL